MGKGWIICKYDNKEIPVGYRCIHLLVEHRSARDEKYG